MKKSIFEGCAVALITPFKDGKIDWDALNRLVDFQLENGSDGIVACGTTAEPPTMENDEWARVLSCIVKRVNGKIPVIAGTGGNNTLHVIRQAKEAADLGADAQLCVTPYYNKTTQNGLIAHYTAIAEQTALPIIIYHVPSRTGLNMKPETFEALCNIPQIVGVKEASGNAALAADILSMCGNSLALYSGSDELTVQLRAIGGSGTISVLANIAPAMMRDMTHLPISEASKVQLRAMKLIRLLFSEVNPIPVKAAAAMMGLCENELRLPLVPLSEEHANQLRAELRKVQLL